MKYFYDTEFIENGKTIDLISFGMCSEDGRDLYLESSEVDWSKSNFFVDENVRPYLEGPSSEHYMTRHQMGVEILRFIDIPGPVELWSWCGSYDHVALAQLWGPMVHLPSKLPWFTRELEQIREGLPLPANEYTQHHALADAWYHRKMWTYFSNKPQRQVDNGHS